MDFKQEDRDMLIRHDQKLKAICDAIGELKKDNKDIKKEMKDGFEKIGRKLDENTLGCSTNRANCRKEIDSSFFTKRVLMWILGFIIIGTISIGAYTSGLATKIAVNDQKIESFHGDNRIE